MTSSAQVPGSVTFDTGVSRNGRPEIGPDEGVQFVEVDYVSIAVENDEKQGTLVYANQALLTKLSFPN